MTKSKIICFSGPDHCGKTSIAKALSDSLGVPYYKASSEHNAFVNDQLRFVNDIKWSCPARLDLLKQTLQQGYVKGVIYDRGWPCEYVYSKLYKRETDERAIFWLDEQYAALGAIIIIPYRSSYYGIRDDLDTSLGEMKLKELEELYREFAKKTKCQVIFLNVDDENLDREVNEILERI